MSPPKKKYEFPPDKVVDSNGEERDVVGYQGGGAYVVYEQDEKRKLITWLELTDPETDWEVVESDG